MPLSRLRSSATAATNAPPATSNTAIISRNDALKLSRTHPAMNSPKRPPPRSRIRRNVANIETRSHTRSRATVPSTWSYGAPVPEVITPQRTSSPEYGTAILERFPMFTPWKAVIRFIDGAIGLIVNLQRSARKYIATKPASNASRM